MKKRHRIKAYTWLIVLTVTAIGGMLTMKAMWEKAVPTVQTAVIARQDVRETVVCTGTVGSAGGVEVYATVPCVAGEIAVDVGDRVKKGDVLVTVDRASTLALAVSAGVSGEQSDAAAILLPETITAPCDGIVSAIGAGAGETLGTSTPCVVLSESGGVVINAVVRESTLPSVALGQQVTVSGVAFDKKSYHGRITDIASTARSRVNGTTTETVVDAVVTLDEGEIDESLLIGLSAKVTVIVEERQDVLVLPYDCLTCDDAGRTVAYRLEGDTAVACFVRTGAERSVGMEILDGLSEGDVVVRDPETLRGDAVRVKTEETA